MNNNTEYSLVKGYVKIIKPYRYNGLTDKHSLYYCLIRICYYINEL